MRYAICAPDSSALRTRWIQRMVAGTCLAVASACSDASTGPTSAASASPLLVRVDALGAADITGIWTYHEDASFLIREYPGDSRAGVKAFRCSSDGVYTFVQSGTALTGSYEQVGTCTANDGTSFPNNFTGITVTGTIQGRHIDFMTADGCRYEATLRGATMDAMGGAGMCGAIKFGGTYRATFSAVR